VPVLAEVRPRCDGSCAHRRRVARPAHDRAVTQRQLDNDRIGGMARSEQDTLPFLCECGSGTCFELVWLSPAQLAAHRADGEPVLAHPGAQLAAA
jgi:hypothetical protein